MDYKHAVEELTKDYDQLRQDAYDNLDINSALHLGIINNYCIFLYKVLQQKEIAVKILDKAFTEYETSVGPQAVDTESDEMKSLIYENIN